MSKFEFTPQLFKAALGLLGMGLREFCSESGVSLTRMSEFQNNPDTSLTNTTIRKIVTFAQNKGVRISEDGVTYIKRIEELYGADGLKLLYDEIYETLNNGGELRAFDISSDLILETLGHEFMNSHIKRMAKIGDLLKGKSMVSQSDMAIERPYMHYRLYQGETGFKQSMIIFENKVAFIKLGASKPYILLQRDIDMADMCRNLFDCGWKSASELEIDFAGNEYSFCYKSV